MEIKRGDVFSIPIDNSHVGYGQIVATRKHDLLIVVFEGKYSKGDIVDLDKLISSKKLLFGITLDGKLYNKHWIIVGNAMKNLDEIKLPYYKVGLWGNFRLVDYQGKVLGNVDDEVGERLYYETTTAPVRYEKALKAHYGIGEWDKDYDELLFDNFYSSYKYVDL